MNLPTYPGHILDIILLLGGFSPTLQTFLSQLGLLFPIYEKKIECSKPPTSPSFNLHCWILIDFWRQQVLKRQRSSLSTGCSISGFPTMDCNNIPTYLVPKPPRIIKQQGEHQKKTYHWSNHVENPEIWQSPERNAGQVPSETIPFPRPYESFHKMGVPLNHLHGIFHSNPSIVRWVPP